MPSEEKPAAAADKPVEELKPPPPAVTGVTVLEQYRYPFENLVFEGGSNKLLAFCGAVRILEETAVWKQIQRLAGSGSGAIAATLLAVGFSSDQMERFFTDDLRPVIKDKSCGACCLACNCFGFGYHPGKAILKWLGSKLKETTGNPNISFAEVHEKFKKELCVVVTNVSKGCLEYCHVKTTPDMPVIDAVRMTLAFPGLCDPVKRKNAFHGAEEIFVEGGVLCNYPIHCYDGWWLSLKPEESFLNKVPSLNNLPHTLDHSARFGTFNSRTVGVVTYDESSLDLFSSLLSEKFKDVERTKDTNTSLSKNRSKSSEARTKLSTTYAQFVSLSCKLLKAIEEQKKSGNDALSKDDVRTILLKCHLSDEEFQSLFGSRTNNAEEVIRIVTPKTRKEMTSQDLHKYLEKKRESLQAQSTRDSSRPIKNVLSYLEAVEETLFSNNLRASIDAKPKDAERTVAINVGYIRASDPSNALNASDRQYLIEQGKLAMRYYLEQHVKKVPQLKDDGERRSFCRDDFKQFIDDDVSEIIDEKDYMETYLEKVL